MLPCQERIMISDTSQVGEARRRGARLSEDSQLNQQSAGKVSIIITELATNLGHYAQGGEILLRSLVSDHAKSIEILAIDRGPGIADIAQCLGDGFSSGGTPGNGLGAIHRLSTEFDLYSSMPHGTVVYSRVTEYSGTSKAASPWKWGIVSLPAPHEDRCGDSWFIAERPAELSIMLVDGLGHGPKAADAAELAVAAFDNDPFATPTRIIQSADTGMRGSRGGAMAVAHVDLHSQSLRYAGVGNISGSLRGLDDATSRGLPSHNGTVGVQIRKIQEFDYEVAKESLLVMHSDGLNSRWSIQSYPGLTMRHPAVIAGVLYRDCTRGPDDVTIAVVRLPGGGQRS